MICFVINCKDEPRRADVIDNVCNALIGSPGYVSGEILVGKDPDSFGVYVVVGYDGRQYVGFPVNGEEIVIEHLDKKGLS